MESGCALVTKAVEQSQGAEDRATQVYASTRELASETPMADADPSDERIVAIINQIHAANNGNNTKIQ